VVQDFIGSIANLHHDPAIQPSQIISLLLLSKIQVWGERSVKRGLRS